MHTMKFSSPLLFAAVLILAAACQQNQSSSSADTPVSPAEENQGYSEPMSEENAQVAFVKYPMLPDSILQLMLEQCDNMEVIFNDLPISMNPKGQVACQTHLEHLAGLPASLHPQSPPAARLFYQSKGNELLQADLYYDDETTAFVFLNNNQPTWSNEMSQKGQDFYKNIVGMMKQAKEQLKSPQ